MNNFLPTVKEVGVYSIPAIFGSIVSYAFGEWTGLVEIFFIAIAFDWITGVCASLTEGKGISSSAGWKGGMKKGLMVATVFFAHRVDLALDLNWVMTSCIYFWLSNELVSIIENFGRCGMPFPESIKKIIATLKNKEDSIK